MELIVLSFFLFCIINAFQVFSVTLFEGKKIFKVNKRHIEFSLSSLEIIVNKRRRNELSNHHLQSYVYEKKEKEYNDARFIDSV